MNDNAIFPLIMLSMYFTLFVGLSITSIGEMPSSEPFGQLLPFKIAFTIGVPAILGYAIGVLDR